MRSGSACSAALVLVAVAALLLLHSPAQSAQVQHSFRQSGNVSGDPMDILARQQLSSLAAYGLMHAQGVRRHINASSVTLQQQPRANTTDLLRRMACEAAPTVKRVQACREANGIPSDGPTMVFKDRQTPVPARKWESIHDLLYSTLDPWTAEELESYLYDMDYVLPPDPSHVAAHDGGADVSTRGGGSDPVVGAHSVLWDPELRLTGSLHCDEADGTCTAPYLPELYYLGDEYMGGWALEGFEGEGLRAAIGPNIAPGDDPANYRYTYIPYTQRIIFAPAASLFFPYLVSIYAGDVYVAEVDPFLTAITRAARAGVVIDYYYVNNYYSSYSFFSTGVASAAVFAATARARGVIGAGVKVRNFNTILASASRDDYNDRNRILILNSLSFLGTSGGGYVFSLPNQRNAFVGQVPRTNLPYYAYDYSGAGNPFPLQPAVG